MRTESYRLPIFSIGDQILFINAFCFHRNTSSERDGHSFVRLKSFNFLFSEQGFLSDMNLCSILMPELLPVDGWTDITNSVSVLCEPNLFIPHHSLHYEFPILPVLWEPDDSDNAMVAFLDHSGKSGTQSVSYIQADPGTLVPAVHFSANIRLCDADLDYFATLVNDAPRCVWSKLSAACWYISRFGAAPVLAMPLVVALVVKICSVEITACADPPEESGCNDFVLYGTRIHKEAAVGEVWNPIPSILIFNLWLNPSWSDFVVVIFRFVLGRRTIVQALLYWRGKIVSFCLWYRGYRQAAVGWVLSP